MIMKLTIRIMWSRKTKSKPSVNFTEFSSVNYRGYPMYFTTGYLFENMSRHQLNSKDKWSSFVVCKDGHGLKRKKIGPIFSSFNSAVSISL